MIVDMYYKKERYKIIVYGIRSRNRHTVLMTHEIHSGFIIQALLGLAPDLHILTNQASSTRFAFGRCRLACIKTSSSSSTRPHRTSAPFSYIFINQASLTMKLHQIGLIGLGSLPSCPHQLGLIGPGYIPSYPNQLGLINQASSGSSQYPHILINQVSSTRLRSLIFIFL